MGWIEFKVGDGSTRIAKIMVEKRSSDDVLVFTPSGRCGGVVQRSSIVRWLPEDECLLQDLKHGI